MLDYRVLTFLTLYDEMNYTHLGLQDAWEELRRIQLNDSQKEMGLRLVKTA